MKPSRASLNRRELLQSLASVGATAALSGCSTLRAARSGSVSSDLIARENSRPGTTDWLLTNTRVDPATKYRCPWIEGYCSHNSIRVGETITLFVSANPACSAGRLIAPSTPTARAVSGLLTLNAITVLIWSRIFPTVSFEKS